MIKAFVSYWNDGTLEKIAVFVLAMLIISLFCQVYYFIYDMIDYTSSVEKEIKVTVLEKGVQYSDRGPKFIFFAADSNNKKSVYKVTSEEYANAQVNKEATIIANYGKLSKQRLL